MKAAKIQRRSSPLHISAFMLTASSAGNERLCTSSARLLNRSGLRCAVGFELYFRQGTVFAHGQGCNARFFKVLQSVEIGNGIVFRRFGSDRQVPVDRFYAHHRRKRIYRRLGVQYGNLLSCRLLYVPANNDRFAASGCNDTAVEITGRLPIQSKPDRETATCLQV